MPRIADPRPALCSACGNSGDPDTRYIDFEAWWDGPDRSDLIAHAPSGAPSATDNIFICEPCVRRGAQLLELKPELHRNQLREIRRLEIGEEHRDDVIKRQGEYIRSLEALLDQAGVKRPQTARRRVAA